MIDAENLEAHFVELHWAMNDMDNFLYETDIYSPSEFYRVVTNKRNPLKHHIEEHDVLNWIEHNRKLMNKAELKEERVE